MSSPEPVDTSLPAEPPIPIPTPQPTATPVPTSTPRPTATPVPTSTPRPTAMPTPTNTPRPTATPQPTATATPEPAATPTPIPKLKAECPTVTPELATSVTGLGDRVSMTMTPGTPFAGANVSFDMEGLNPGELGRGDFCRPGGTGSRLGYRRGRLGILDHPILPGRRPRDRRLGAVTARKTSLEIGRSTFSRAGR